MAMTRPIVSTSPFAYDAKNEYIIPFIIIGGNVVEGNIVSIIDNISGTEVYNNNTKSRLYQLKIPANSLQNGKIYRYKIKTYDINNLESEWSQEALFYTSDTPIITVNITPNQIISNSSYNLIGTFTQAQNNILVSYTYNLYDSNNNLVKTSGALRDISKGIIWDLIGLLDNVQYKIELICIDNKQMIGNSGKISFSVNYVNPSFFAVLQLENVAKEGKIKATSNIINVGGNVVVGSGDVAYEKINGEDEVVVTTSGQKIQYSEGISFNGDFSEYLDTKYLLDKQEFLTFYDSDDTESFPKRIVLKYELGRIQVHKINGTVDYYIYSEPISFDDIVIKRIWLQQKNQLLEIKVP